MLLEDTMTFERINVQFKDLHPSFSVHTTQAFIVFVDRTNPDTNPDVFILKDHKLNDHDFRLMSQGVLSIDQDAFILAGQLEQIDKKGRQIVLTNQNTILYKHLVVVSGFKAALLGDEFVAGVQTLVEALQMRKKIPKAFGKTISNGEKSNSKASLNTLSDEKKIQGISDKQIPSELKLESNFADSALRLYEIQI